jgi:hypothetical protein
LIIDKFLDDNQMIFSELAAYGEERALEQEIVGNTMAKRFGIY